jgi:hypothetical protein
MAFFKVTQVPDRYPVFNYVIPIQAILSTERVPDPDP